MNLLEQFCELSGEKLNPSKSQIIFPSWLSESDRSDLCLQTGFSAVKLPITYLGAPLYKGRTLIADFQYLVDRVRKRIHGWAKNLLSMGGRIQLVKSVLNAMSVHAMFTLPVPRAVIDQLVSIMAAFIWDDGEIKKRHWIGWEKICLPKSHGGLSIRHPLIMLQALHGKRAWDLIMGKSLWARYARSRFRLGSSGSPLWNSLSTIIPKVKAVGTWRIGNGDTSVHTICQRYGISTPPSCQRKSLREITHFNDIYWGFIGVIPATERDIFRNITFTTDQDRFICKYTGDETFSVKAYAEHLEISGRVRPDTIRPWGNIIWRAWIPPKISSFLWKLFHRVIPTDENIKKITIPLPSKCRCCLNSSNESSDHLFFSSEWAIQTWDKLSSIFDRPRPRGIGSLCHFWLQGNKKCFLDCLASGMASCLLWEIWKARNEVIHRSRTRPIWNSCLAWAPRIAGSTKASFTPSMQALLTIQACHIQPPAIGGSSHEWRPPEASQTRDDSAIAQTRYNVRPFIDDSLV